ncbi:MAG: nicotinamide riboside transporter PnuC [Firmicutes bacterium]|nr:nicotinamide riboside transporter PnuC [Bacillota bacterium]
MKKLGFTVWDLCLFLAAQITVVALAIVFESNWLVIVNCVLGLCVVFLQAKAKIINRFVGVVYLSFYVALAYTTNYYGEMIIYGGLIIPLYIYGIFHWLRHRDSGDKTVVVVRNNLPAREWGG